MPKEDINQQKTLHEDQPLIIGSHWIFDGIKSNQITPKLKKLIHLDIFHESEDVFNSAVNLCRKLGNGDTINYLMVVIKQLKKEKKIAALDVLKDIGNPSTASKLTPIFNKIPDVDVRARILEMLVKWQPEDPQVRKTVVFYTQDNIEETPLKFAAVKCLGLINEKKELINILNKSENPEILKVAVESMAACNKSDVNDIIDAIGENFIKMDDEGKIAAYHTLSLFKSTQAMELIKNTIAGEKDNFIIKVLEIFPKYRMYFNQPDRITRYIFFKLPASSDLLEEGIYASFQQFYEMLDPDNKMLSDLTNSQILKLKSATNQTIEHFLSQYVARIDLFKKQKFNKLDLFEIKLNNMKDFMEKFSTKEFHKMILDYFRNKEYEPNDPVYLQILNSIKVKSREISKGYIYMLHDVEDLLKTKDRHSRLRIANHLQNVDLEKPVYFMKLRRILYFLGLTTGGMSNSSLINNIYQWGYEQSDFKLCSAAIHVMARIKYENALDIIEEGINNQVDQDFITNLIIALRELGDKKGISIILDFVKNIDLLASSDLLQYSIVETLSELSEPGDYEVLDALLKLFLGSKINTIVIESARAIGNLATPVMLENLLLHKDNADDTIREYLVSLIGRVQARDKDPVNTVRYQNFYYSMLNDNCKAVRVQAIRNLYKLCNDEKSITALFELYDNNRGKEKANIIAGAMEIDHAEHIDRLLKMLTTGSEEVVDAASSCLRYFIDKRSRYSDYILRQVIEIRQGDKADNELDEMLDTGNLVLKEREIDEQEKYWFEKDKTHRLAVLFIDIVGYTKKSSSMELISVINYLRTYEEIVFGVTEQHNGNVVKKMGDGLMISFEKSLDAALAGIRIQERLHNYNMFKDEAERIITRIGINTGDVAVTENDLFGDTVNVASRLEHISQPTKILISQEVYNEISNYIQCKEMGPTTVRGIKEPLNTFEVISISAALGDDLDPLSNKKDSAASLKSSSATKDQKALSELLLLLKNNYALLYKEIERYSGLSSKDRERFKKIVLKQWGEAKSSIATMLGS